MIMKRKLLISSNKRFQPVFLVVKSTLFESKTKQLVFHVRVHCFTVLNLIQVLIHTPVHWFSRRFTVSQWFTHRFTVSLIQTLFHTDSGPAIVMHVNQKLKILFHAWERSSQLCMLPQNSKTGFWALIHWFTLIHWFMMPLIHTDSLIHDAADSHDSLIHRCCFCGHWFTTGDDVVNQWQLWQQRTQPQISTLNKLQNHPVFLFK